MPSFPHYPGPLPEILRPLNPRHYLLLTYWLYFRPTALKTYLYRADPTVYRTDSGLGIFRAYRIPAYRNLYLLIPVTALLISVSISLPVVLASRQTINWGSWAFGVSGALSLGVLFGVAVAVANSIYSGTASGLVGAVAFGMAFGVAFVLVFSLANDMPANASLDVVRVLALGVSLGIVFGAAYGTTGGVAFGAPVGVALSVTLAMALNRFHIPSGLLFAVAGIGGALRIPFYLVQLCVVWLYRSRPDKHPVLWDELLVLPLPRTQTILLWQLIDHEQSGIALLANVARNPYQRWLTQRALKTYLHQLETPLHTYYALLNYPELNTFAYAPVSGADWERVSAVKFLLLGELAGRWVNYGSERLNRLVERLIWLLTCPFRNRRRTDLTRFAGMLYDLLSEEAISANGFDLARYQDAYTGIAGYPGGAEISHSFETMSSFLNYRVLDHLPALTDLNRSDFEGQAIRPAVLDTLVRLAEVGAEVGVYRASTTQVNKLAALARASDVLQALDKRVQAGVMPPEQAILRRIIRYWQALVIGAGGEAARTEEIRPVANPYVAGNPVSGELFAGREDIMRRLEELWTGEGQWPLVVLYGHRRMGKSSILQNLGARFGSHTTLVDFNMQRAGLVDSTGELLYNLALALHDTQPDDIPEPGEERFFKHNPYTAFDRFLKKLAPKSAGQRYIVTVDEFELVEALMREGKVEVRLLDFLRGLIHTYPWFVMIFAGLHTLQEMTRDYWHPLFGSVITIPVSFLRPAAARRLITQPSSDFALDYDAEAVEHIINLTNGQPYLMQLIGHGLVSRFNRQIFEADVQHSRRFSLADVEAIINAPEFFRDGHAYFAGVWQQAKSGIAPHQTTILRALAKYEPGLSTAQIVAETGLPPSGAKRALDELARHDVIAETETGWRFTVELMRRWAG